MITVKLFFSALALANFCSMVRDGWRERRILEHGVKAGAKVRDEYLGGSRAPHRSFVEYTFQAAAPNHDARSHNGTESTYHYSLGFNPPGSSVDVFYEQGDPENSTLASHYLELQRRTPLASNMIVVLKFFVALAGVLFALSAVSDLRHRSAEFPNSR